MLDHESRVLLERRGLDLHGKRVLIVEDDYLTAECLSHTIADYGFTVVGPVSTADRAVRLIGQEPPDGALLDVRLRKGSAVDVAKALQERGVPFVVMSGYSQDTLPLELKKAPFIAKPMTESELIDTARSTFQQ
jgi:DNA-binding NtrC family response regulator